MDGGLELPGEDWTRLALGNQGLGWGFRLGLVASFHEGMPGLTWSAFTSGLVDCFKSWG